MLCSHRPRNLSLFWLGNTICSREKVLKAVLAGCVPMKQLPRSHCLVDSGATDGTASGIRKWKKPEVTAAQGWAGDQHLSCAEPWNWAVNHMGTPMCTWLILTECFSLAWWPKWRILVTMNYLNMNKHFEIKPRCLLSLPAYNGWHGYLEKKKFRFKPSFFKISGDFRVVELHVIPHLHLPSVHIAFWFSLVLLSLGSAMCQLLILHCTWAGSHFASLIPGLEEQSRFWWLLAIFLYKSEAQQYHQRRT